MTKLKRMTTAAGAAGVLAALCLAGPAAAFEGDSVAATDCDYGGKIKSIEAVDELTTEVRFADRTDRASLHPDRYRSL